PGATAGEIYSAIQSDWYWRIPAVGFADAHAASARAATHMYEFTWPSPQGGGRLGAAHGCEWPSSLTPWDSGPKRCWDPTRPKRWPTRCMAPGSNSPRRETAAGPRTA